MHDIPEEGKSLYFLCMKSKLSWFSVFEVYALPDAPVGPVPYFTLSCTPVTWVNFFTKYYELYILGKWLIYMWKLINKKKIDIHIVQLVKMYYFISMRVQKSIQTQSNIIEIGAAFEQLFLNLKTLVWVSLVIIIINIH